MEPEKKEVDLVIKKCIKQFGDKHHRSLFTICGPKADQQVYVINHLITKRKKTQSILWCHESSSDSIRLKKKQIRNVKKRLKKGEDPDITDIQENFLAVGNIKFCDYDETASVLGNTYNMCVLQDVQFLTPNKLCHVVETVRGGGVIVFLLPEFKSIEELKELPMDIHSRYKTSTNPTADFLFMKRFVTSLRWCISSAMLTDDLQICEGSRPPKVGETVVPYKPTELGEILDGLAHKEELLKKLLPVCCTADQANVLTKMTEVLKGPVTKNVLSVTASRGRGKSAILGLGAAAAIQLGVLNIYLVAPSPLNVQTFFQFLVKGLDALGFEDKTHYEIYQATNEDFNNAIIGACVFKSKRRQYIQYLEPCDYKKISHPELVVIDEAAAIPLVQVKALLGPYHVFLASTVSGYEGTGRGLSLKLLDTLRSEPERRLHELTMETSIRYAPNDPVEHWLYKLLCLDATAHEIPLDFLPGTDACELYYVNKKMLFNGHRHSEELLRNIMSLLVASHYKNTPDDLQLLADNPAHHLFILLRSLPTEGKVTVPCVYTVIQVCFEGGFSRTEAEKALRQGGRPSGDLVSWGLSRMFSDPQLACLKGLRIVRIASLPRYHSFGYGTRAISLLKDYFNGHMHFLNQDTSETEPDSLLTDLSERKPEAIDYIGVSFGLSQRLFKFWSKCMFQPLQISNTLNSITGEHNGILVFPLGTDFPLKLPAWFEKLPRLFMDNFLYQLMQPLQSIPTDLAVNIVDCYRRYTNEPEIQWKELGELDNFTRINDFDCKLLKSYMNNVSERYVVTHILPALAYIFFFRKLPDLNLSMLQARLLIGTGFQRRSVEQISTEIDQPLPAILGQFKTGIDKLAKAVLRIREECVRAQIEKSYNKKTNMVPVPLLDDITDPALDDTTVPFEENLGQYAVNDVDSLEWSEAVRNEASIVTIKSKKKYRQMTDKELEKELEPPAKKKKNRKK